MRGGGFAMVFFALLMLGGLVLLGAVLVRALRGGISSGTGGRQAAPGADLSARKVLDERYARGELSTEEYQERLRVLEGRD